MCFGSNFDTIYILTIDRSIHSKRMYVNQYVMTGVYRDGNTITVSGFKTEAITSVDGVYVLFQSFFFDKYIFCVQILTV